MNIEEILKSHGKSITQERLEVYDWIQDMHLFQASDLIDKFSRIGRASIFRIIALFVEIGVLRKLNLENRWDFYELASHSHHEHFECNNCHMILHFDAGFICKTLDFFAKKQWFLLQNHQILLSGICPHCNQK